MPDGATIPAPRLYRDNTTDYPLFTRRNHPVQVQGSGHQALRKRATASLGASTSRLIWRHLQMGTSTFSQYTVVAEVSVVKINDKAPLEKGA